MKAFIYKTSIMRFQGEVIESESLDQLCSFLFDVEDFGNFHPELVVSKPELEHPYDEREKECDWVIEICDDYREELY